MKRLTIACLLGLCGLCMAQVPPYVRNPVTTNTIAPGSAGDVLTLDGTGKPAWVAPVSVTNASFMSVTSGTNTVATMAVGTGAILKTDGTGVIDANRYRGVTTVDATEFGYLDGVTNSIQTQLNQKGLFSTISSGTNTTATMAVGTGATLKYDGTGVINASQFRGVTTVDATEFGYLDGVTNAIQTQLGWKPDMFIVNTVSDLKTIAGSSTKTNAWVNGRTSVNDGGGGMFYWTSTGTTNLGTCFAGSSGYWNRYYRGQPVNVCWFGATGTDMTDDYTAIQAAITFAQTFSGYPNSGPAVVYFPPGRYYVSQSLVVNYVGSNFSLVLMGDSQDTSWIVGTMSNGTACMIIDNPQTTVERLAFTSTNKYPPSWTCDGLFVQRQRCAVYDCRFRNLSRGLVLSNESGVYDVRGIYADGCVLGVQIADDYQGVGAVTMSSIHVDECYEVGFMANGLVGSTLSGLHDQASPMAMMLTSVSYTTISSGYKEDDVVNIGYAITNYVASLTVNPVDMMTCTLVLTNQAIDLKPGVSVTIWDAVESEFNGTFTLSTGSKVTNVFTFTLPSPASHTNATGSIKVRLVPSSSYPAVDRCSFDFRHMANGAWQRALVGSIKNCKFSSMPCSYNADVTSVQNISYDVPVSRLYDSNFGVYQAPRGDTSGWFDRPVNYFPDPDLSCPTNWITSITLSTGVTASFVEVTNSCGANKKALRIDFPASSANLTAKVYLDSKWFKPLLGSKVIAGCRIWMPAGTGLLSPYSAYPSASFVFDATTYICTAKIQENWGSADQDTDAWFWMTHSRNDIMTKISSPYIQFGKLGRSTTNATIMIDSIYVGKAGVGNMKDILNQNWVNYWEDTFIGGDEAYTGDNGYAIKIEGGRAHYGDTNKNGGTLYLNSGIATGTGTGSVVLQTAGTTSPTPTATALVTVTNTPATGDTFTLKYTLTWTNDTPAGTSWVLIGASAQESATNLYTALGAMNKLYFNDVSVADANVYVQASPGYNWETKGLTGTWGTMVTNYVTKSDVFPTAALTVDGYGNVTLNKGTQTTIRSLTYTWPTAHAIGALTNNGSGTLGWAPLPIEIGSAVTGETEALTVGTAKVTFRVPRSFTLTAVRASLSTAQTSGSLVTVDINENGTSILSTPITIDNGEKTSVTAAAQPVISDNSIADDAEITVDIDQIGDGTAKGLKIWLIGTR